MVLRDIMEQLSDAATAKAVGIRHDNSRGAYRARAVLARRPVESLGQLMQLCTDVYQHQWKHAVLQDPNAAELPKEEAWWSVSEFLKRRYGGPRGALRAAKLGVDGGVRGVVECIYEGLKSIHIAAYHRSVLREAIDPTDWDGRVALARQLLRSVSCVVPENKQRSAEELESKLSEVLQRQSQLSNFSTKGGGSRR